jgi:hypothetical protein
MNQNHHRCQLNFSKNITVTQASIPAEGIMGIHHMYRTIPFKKALDETRGSVKAVYSAAVYYSHQHNSLWATNYMIPRTLAFKSANRVSGSTTYMFSGIMTTLWDKLKFIKQIVKYERVV